MATTQTPHTPLERRQKKMSLSDNMVVIAIVSTAVGSITTGVIGVFGGWWRRKTSITVEVIENQGKLRESNERLWEKLILLKKVAENQGWKIPDREWNSPGEKGRDE